ncbi:PAC2 (Proteasome assembly chaperone) family [Bifidobacterium magnum]|uniref:PAC2 (Proteasome assembly chaperone) family n=2 Tax=Bifidobacterium magnum TaxID=1692 RepID=A0A087BA26_9BIFI|nr:PAC2 (Proteasome assembly chaperone) family [Bifidobacterium magnum]
MYDQASKHRVAMVCAFDGWNDACHCATDVIHQLVSRYPSTEVAHINRDGYYDYQVSRPIQCNIQGYRRILWPQTTFYDIAVSDTFHILAEMGPEPNYGWIEYCQESLRIAREYEVSHVYTLGSMFADCPHTRPLPMDIMVNGEPVDEEYEHNGPIGIPQVLDASAEEEGYATTSLWVSVPKYLGNNDCALGTAQLLQALSRSMPVNLMTEHLENRAEQWRSHADIILRNTPDLTKYVEQLEREYDMREQARHITKQGSPAVEQLVSDAEEFLRGLPHDFSETK